MIYESKVYVRNYETKKKLSSSFALNRWEIYYYYNPNNDIMFIAWY